MEYAKHYESVDYFEEPAFMASFYRIMQNGIRTSSAEPFGASVSKTKNYPQHHVQAGNFLGNIDYDDISVAESIRERIRKRNK